MERSASLFRIRTNRALDLIRNRFSYALGDQVVYSFGNMVVAALLSRHAGARSFGIYILTQRTLDILVQLSNTLSWAPFTFNLPSTPPGRVAYYRGSIFLQQLLCCLLSMPLLALAAHWAAAPHRTLYRETFQPLLFTAAVLLFREFNRRMYFADLRMREALWTDTATVALQIAGVVYCLHRGSLDVPHTLWALALGAGALSLWWLLRERRTLRFSTGDLLGDTVRNFRLGRWFLGSNFVFVAGSQANPWLLGAAFGGGSVGGYAVCESIVNIPRVALVSLQNVFAPILARAYAQGGKPLLRERVARLDRLLLVGSAATALAVVALGPFVAGLLFGKAVPGDARTVLFFLALNFVAFSATLAQGYALSAIDRARPTLLANLAGLLVQACAALLLVRRFALPGIAASGVVLPGVVVTRFAVPGVAAALCLGSVVTLLVRQLYYNRELPAGADLAPVPA